TYVRALARDLGASLGVGGHLTALRRTSIGPFAVGDAVPLAGLVDGDVRVDEVILSPARAASVLYPSVRLEPQQARDLRDGKRPEVDAPDSELAAMIDADGHLIGLSRIVAGVARVVMNLP